LPLAALVAVAVVGVVVFLGLSRQHPEKPANSAAAAPAALAAPSTPAPNKPAAPVEEVKRLFELANDFWKNNPKDFAGALAQFEKVQAAARGTEYEGKVAEAIAAINKSRAVRVEYSGWGPRLQELRAKLASVDPQGPAQGKGRVMRGGSCCLSAGDCRPAFRIGYPPDRVNGHVGGFGLRVVVEAVANK
jgi:formylglycine-generating enzyme required for sulfatase activity